MKTSTIVVLGIVAAGVIAAGYLLLRPARQDDRPPTWGERLGAATGDVGDAIGSLGRLFS